MPVDPSRPAGEAPPAESRTTRVSTFIKTFKAAVKHFSTVIERFENSGNGADYVKEEYRKFKARTDESRMNPDEADELSEFLARDGNLAIDLHFRYAAAMPEATLEAVPAETDAKTEIIKMEFRPNTELKPKILNFGMAPEHLELWISQFRAYYSTS